LVETVGRGVLAIACLAGACGGPDPTSPGSPAPGVTPLPPGDPASLAPYLVRDIRPGADSSMSDAYAGQFFPFRGRVLFVADDGTHGLGLWATDGTAEGTRLVADICPGSCSSNPTWFCPYGIAPILRVESRHSFRRTEARMKARTDIDPGLSRKGGLLTQGTLALALALLAAFVPRPALGQTVSRTFAFESDKWYLLDDAKEGPVTLHRIQVARQHGHFTKSTLFRPGNSEYLVSIEIKLEYSNSATKDWKAKFRLALLDEGGQEIDGYNGKEDLNDQESHNLVTIKLSTLKYALERARKLRVVIECEPD
jgi:ELWxxDGT repeat protein